MAVVSSTLKPSNIILVALGYNIQRPASSLHIFYTNFQSELADAINYICVLKEFGLVLMLCRFQPLTRNN